MKRIVSGLGVIIHYELGGIYKLQINDLSWETPQDFRYDRKKGRQKVSVYDDIWSLNPLNRKIYAQMHSSVNSYIEINYTYKH